MNVYRFEMDLDVHDEKDLHLAAVMYYQQQNAARDPQEVMAEAIEMLGPKDEPDVEACLVMLLDPGQLAGCSIHNSSAEYLSF
jgi:hypothetical protein